MGHPKPAATAVALNPVEAPVGAPRDENDPFRRVSVTGMSSARPELTVVTPAFNQATTVVRCLDRLTATLERSGLNYEIVVVSDGSRDDTAANARRRESDRIRVVEYDRNLGKGYALRVGSSLASGRYVAWLDSDLDLDPAPLVDFVRHAQEADLDIVVGSKRHPGSVVDYPRKRHIYSWLFQRLVRCLFRLDVRDTQVGIKLFRREVLEAVLPTVVVKRFAFDLEMLAVARHFGFGRIAEGAVRLDYQFTGTGMNWRAIANALWDTGAIFYRLRILRFYDRQRALALEMAAYANEPLPTLTLVLAPGQSDRPDPDREARLCRLLPAGSRVLVIPGSEQGGTCADAGPEWVDLGERTLETVLAADTDVVAFLENNAEPATHWAEAALSLLRNPSVGAVVGPTVPRLTGEPCTDAAGVLSESRMGLGSARTRHHVGRLHEVEDFPARNLFIRRDSLLRLLSAGVQVADRLCAELRTREGLAVIASPHVVATTMPRPLFARYLADLGAHAVRRGLLLASGAPLRLRHVMPLLVLAYFGLAPVAFFLGQGYFLVWSAGFALYLLSLLFFGGVVVLLHRRGRVAVLALVGAALSHFVVGACLIAGAFQRIVLKRRADERTDGATVRERAAP